MKYSEYPYERIDLDKFKNKIELMINDFSNAESAEKQIKIIQEYQEIQKEYHSFGSIAHLNYARNTKDKKAIEENKFYNEVGPEVAAIDNKFTKAINSSKFKKNLLEKFGDHYFELISMELKSFDSKLVELMKEEMMISVETESNVIRNDSNIIPNVLWDNVTLHQVNFHISFFCIPALDFCRL